MASLDELVTALKMAGAGQQQIAQETANWHKAQAVLNKPRHLRATPFAAVATGRYTRSAEAADYWSKPPEERAAVPPEPTKVEIQKEISREHRRLSAEGGDPARLAELLKKKRAK